MSFKHNDRQHTAVDKAYCAKETKENALQVLHQLHEDGLLQPVPDYEGGTVAAYADMLGLK